MVAGENACFAGSPDHGDLDLREAYINGEEFTMGGHPMRLVKVEAPAEDVSAPGEEEETGEGGPAPPPKGSGEAPAKVVSLLDRKPKKRG